MHTLVRLPWLRCNSAAGCPFWPSPDRLRFSRVHEGVHGRIHVDIDPALSLGEAALAGHAAFVSAVAYKIRAAAGYAGHDLGILLAADETVWAIGHTTTPFLRLRLRHKSCMIPRAGTWVANVYQGRLAQLMLEAGRLWPGDAGTECEHRYLVGKFPIWYCGAGR
jgi:hypothetical protein